MVPSQSRLVRQAGHRKIPMSSVDGDVCHRPGGDIGIYRLPSPSARLGRFRCGRTGTMSVYVAQRSEEGPAAMAVALAPSQSGRRQRRAGGWLQMGALKERQQIGGLIRLAAVAAVGCSVVLPLLELARIVAGWTPSPGRATLVLVATACYLPLYVQHVWYAARGSRPAGAGWTLLAMAVVILGALPFIGTSWLISLHSLAVSVLIIVSLPWSLLAAASLVAATVPLAAAFDDPHYWTAFYTVSVVWRGAVVFVLVWLVGAARRLEHARLLLAEQALARERLRIDGELRCTLGAALEAIAASGGRASALAAGDAAALEDELRALAECSRRALAQARRTIRGYQRPSLRAELDSAAALLTAAGIQARVEVPRGELPQTVDDDARAALRAAVAALLREDGARRCSIVATRQDGRVRLELRAGGTGPATARVVAWTQ